MCIYLYKKTHNKTGLQYLGKTTQDPVKYTGSGRIWREHIRQHGNDVTTEIIKECSTKEELSRWGRFYSEQWNIVKSAAWANLIPETGGGPGRSGFNSGINNPMYGRSRDDLKIENGPNKCASKKMKHSILTRKMWENDKHRKRHSELITEKWKNTEYLEKMKARPKQFKKVMINEIEYSSLKEAAMSLGIDPSTVSKRCTSSNERFVNWYYVG